MSSPIYGHPLIDRLVEEIPARHLTQVEAAAEIGVSVRTLQYWLSKEAPVPQPRHRRAILNWLERQEVAA